MKSGLVILPFLAVFIAAFSTALNSAFPDKPMIAYVGWALSLGVVAAWVYLDAETFKRFVHRKGARYGASSGLVVVLGIGVVIGLAVVTSRPRFNKQLDVTRSQSNTLSDQSVKIVQNLSEKNQEVEVIGFFQDEAVQTQFRDTMALYLARGGKFNIQYLDPQRDPTKAMSEKITVGNTAIFRLGPQETRVTTFNEEKITNALLQVMKANTKKVYFTKGHGEGELRGGEAGGFQNIVQELEGNKYEVKEANLLELAKVPEDADLLVIAGPKYDFREEETRFIDDFLKSGHSAMVMVDAVTPVPTLAKLLDKYGLQLQNDLLILRPDDPRAQMIGQNIAIVSTFDDLHPITKEFSKQTSVTMLLPSARSIGESKENSNGMKVTLVAKASDINIKVKDVKTAADLKALGKDRFETGDFAVMAAATGKSTAPATANAETGKKDEAKTDAGVNGDSNKTREIRLVAVGSAQFATNSGMQAAQNRDLFVNATNYLLRDEDFISIRPKELDKSSIEVSSASAVLLLMFLAWIYPFMFLGGGVMSWVMRRRA